MFYEFIKLWEMDTTRAIYTTWAKDYHDAMRNYIVECGQDYDTILVNGEFVFWQD